MNRFCQDVISKPASCFSKPVYFVVVVVVFTLKTALTSIQYPSLSYSSRQRNEFPWSHLGTCIIFFSQVLGLSLGLFYFYRYFSVPYFGLACDHGNSFLCLVLKSKKEKGTG